MRELRRLRIASTSSTKRTQGDSLAAREKMARTERTPSPSHLEATVLGLMVRKLAPHSAATALASSVLPVPAARHGRRLTHGFCIQAGLAALGLLCTTEAETPDFFIQQEAPAEASWVAVAKR